MDTRLLEKPKSFDGTTDSWRQFKFTFLGYAGAVDSIVVVAGVVMVCVAGCCGCAVAGHSADEQRTARER